jgi:hypothetical protein
MWFGLVNANFHFEDCVREITPIKNITLESKYEAYDQISDFCHQ